MANGDEVLVKQAQRESWAAAAEGWRRRDELLRKGAAPVSDRMLELVAIGPGSNMLDIASGTGEPAISAAQIVGPSGSVLGTDLVEEMLIVAREKADAQGLDNVEFKCIDAETLDYDEGTFDAVTIRWGLMFMPKPEACLRPALKSLKPGGRISVACWSDPQKNPFVGMLMQPLRKFMEVPVPPPGTPGIFAMADPKRLRGVLSSAGFKNIELEEMNLDVIEVKDGQAYWEAMSDLAAPVMVLVDQLGEADRTAYVAEVIESANSFQHGDSLRMKGVTWIAVAEK